MPRQYSEQFTKLAVEYRQPVAGFDIYMAVWHRPGHTDLVIGAPSIDVLASEWEAITGVKLDRPRVQHSIITACNTPPELWEQAKAAATTAGAPVEVVRAASRPL